MYAVNLNINGMKFVPHGVRGGVRTVPESDVDIDEAGDTVLDDASASESVPDTGSEDEVVPVATTMRSRRPAVIHNVADF